VALVVLPGKDDAEVMRLPADPAMFAEVVRGILGGPLESLGVAGGDWGGYCNSHYLRQGLPANHHGDALVRSLGYPFALGEYLHGPLVLTGREADHETDVPLLLLDLAKVAGLRLRRAA
jgi:hypothetical protein